ncbi:GNAT family N-acetyltransferase [Leekyejoonella antrihumi]|uniref:GNAT family N-acetyltransferase n=1 Tax=Leekyejoonella antrihumi TaxID=1660198 RepID=A0A563DX87_9MICO|nr:GNAT family N-acetyltransferase [Leekyejoonella antrihumi]TWP34562.1 GNAT family N-acetyltransferase [Leekyejoonella antrihumi]
MVSDFNEVELTTRFRPGMRVVVRYRTGDSATDALGDVIDVTADTVTVHTRRRGAVRITRDAILLAKPVPPAPARRGRPHLAIGMDDLQELMVAAMPPLQSQWLGRWLLRSAEGYTGRANSVLPLGDPGLPLSAAVTHAEQWYAALGQPALMELFGPTGFDPAADALGTELVQRGWRIFQRTLIMTADAAVVAASSTPGSIGGSWAPGSVGSPSPVEIAVTDSPTDAWWSGTSERGQAHRGTFEKVLTRVEQPVYVTASRHDRTQAVGRAAISAGWAGLFEINVRSEARRQGLGRLVVATAAARAQAHGIRLVYLQVSEDNEAAVELYRSMGFAIHHEYYYARSQK